MLAHAASNVLSIGVPSHIKAPRDSVPKLVGPKDSEYVDVAAAFAFTTRGGIVQHNERLIATHTVLPFHIPVIAPRLFL